MQDLLFLVHRIPYPPNKGDKIRSFHFLNHLSTRYKVHLATFIDDENDWQYTAKVDALCISSCYQVLKPLHAKLGSVTGLLTGDALSVPYYRNQVLQAWVDNTLKTQAIKKVLVFSSVMGQFIKPEHGVDMVVDFVDIDSDKWRQYAEKKRGIAKWIYQREAKYLFDFEQALAAKAKVSAFVSAQEAELFKKFAPSVSDKITHINNGVDVVYFSPEQDFVSPYPVHAEQVLVFTGAMDYWANVDAVVWFVEQVFSLLIKTHPQLRFYIVGAKPSKAVQDLANSQVIVTGSVPDVRPYIAYAHVVVAPLRIARGIQNKVLEAMAMAKYVLATSAAMEGISVDSALSVAISDDAATMIEQLKVLLGADGVIAAPTNRAFVKAQFSWENNLNALLALLA
ncbi:TIGR03087 family PEP-CTERM/XrtA system glycosyltransferase [Crenothrix polyspora]|uniref:Glycosyl transferase, group 1 n=1 Tax=Crenothrix polyspora TaxID=360316 RepID=A0A1R4HD33_9GAMM|nr:TIGR03087 family PEP-CTERM/XrtA system glycosyltransferase [Crenothrix polyspora]SJM94126.1 Glycosyl transferase, group 1 [Crenothrix polyspora]